MDDVPITIGLVFDSSGSMRLRLDLARMAASAFFLTANPEDEFFSGGLRDRAAALCRDHPRCCAD
jgi:Ca-activated chloride channel homolog